MGRGKKRKKVFGQCDNCLRVNIQIIKVGPPRLCAACYYYFLRHGTHRPAGPDTERVDIRHPHGFSGRDKSGKTAAQVIEALKMKVKSLEIALDRAESDRDFYSAGFQLVIVVT